MLSLLDSHDAWLDCSDPWLQLHLPGRGGAAPRHPAALSLFSTAVAAAAPTGSGDSGGVPVVVTLRQVQKEYQLLKAACGVTAKVPGG